VEQGASFVTGAGWERPQWFEANRELVDGVTHEWSRRSGWAAREWSPIEGGEHLAVRAGAGLFDITPYVKLLIHGPDALAFMERLSTNRMDREVGTLIYTGMLTKRGGIRCDVVVARLDEDAFQLVTGGGSGMHDQAWIRAQQRDDERVTIEDRTGQSFTLGIWGPRARDIVQSVTDDDLSGDAFPYMTWRAINIGETPIYAQRISYVGELGWELYGQVEMGQRLWDTLWEVGRSRGLIAAGLGAFDAMRLEKGYRLWGQDIDTEHDPLSAGLGFAVRWDKEFNGKAALEEIRDRGPAKRLVPMTFDDPSHVVVGKEPIRHDGRVVSYVTSAGYGYSVGRGIVYGYLPADLAIEGTPVEVQYFGERYAATVAAEPLFDPKGERLRA
jgi:glycine cleavage system aminomethyltransferase T